MTKHYLGFAAAVCLFLPSAAHAVTTVYPNTSSNSYSGAYTPVTNVLPQAAGAAAYGATSAALGNQGLGNQAQGYANSVNNQGAMYGQKSRQQQDTTSSSSQPASNKQYVYHSHSPDDPLATLQTPPKLYNNIDPNNY